MVTLIQWSSLQKSVSKFTPKKFYDIDPSGVVWVRQESLLKGKAQYCWPHSTIFLGKTMRSPVRDSVRPKTYLQISYIILVWKWMTVGNSLA